MLGVFGFVVSGYHQVVVLHAFHEWQEDVEVFLFLHLAEREEEVSVAQRLDGGGAVLSAFGQVLDAVVDDLLGLAFEVEYKAGVLLYKMGDECKFVGPVAPALHFFTVFGLFLGLFLVDEVHIVDGQYDVCSGTGGAKKGTDPGRRLTAAGRRKAPAGPPWSGSGSRIRNTPGGRRRRNKG